MIIKKITGTYAQAFSSSTSDLDVTVLPTKLSSYFNRYRVKFKGRVRAKRQPYEY